MHLMVNGAFTHGWISIDHSSSLICLQIAAMKLYHSYLKNELFFENLFFGWFSWKLQSDHDGSDVQVELNVEHEHDLDIFPNMTRNPRIKYITHYEDSESIPGKKTAVWELDKGAWCFFYCLWTVDVTYELTMTLLSKFGIK